MIKKIQISDASIAEEVRSNMPVATNNKKGLLDAGISRYVKSDSIFSTERNVCVKLYSTVGQASISAIINSGRIEGGVNGAYLLSFSSANIGSFFCNLIKLNNGYSSEFYYTKDGNRVSIYIVSFVDYSIINIAPLLENGNFIYHLTKEPLPDGAIKIEGS